MDGAALRELLSPCMSHTVQFAQMPTRLHSMILCLGELWELHQLELHI